MSTPLKDAREARKLTTYQVAAAVGIAQSHYNRIENEEAGASPEVAAKLASYFGNAVTEMQILYPSRFERRTKPHKSTEYLQFRLDVAPDTNLLQLAEQLRPLIREHGSETFAIAVTLANTLEDAIRRHEKNLSQKLASFAR